MVDQLVVSSWGPRMGGGGRPGQGPSSAAPPGGRGRRPGEFEGVVALHLRVFQRRNLLTYTGSKGFF